MPVRLGTTQIVTGNATASTSSSAFTAGITQVRVIATAACNLRISDGTVTAVTTDTALAPNVPEYFTITPSQKIAVIGAATVNITECQQSK